jgi:hypothetical protein
MERASWPANPGQENDTLAMNTTVITFMVDASTEETRVNQIKNIRESMIFLNVCLKQESLLALRAKRRDIFRMIWFLSKTEMLAFTIPLPGFVLD